MKPTTCLFLALISLLTLASAVAQTAKTSSFSIAMLGGFDKDRVKILIDSKTVFNKTISSDFSTSLAGSCSFKKTSHKQKVSVIINGHQMRSTYLDYSKIHNKILGIWKHEEFISYTFYDIPLVLE